MNKAVYIMFLTFFLTACSAPPKNLSFVHVVPTYQEVAVGYEEFVPSVPQVVPVRYQHPSPPTDIRPQAPNPRPLADAGSPCFQEDSCLGFCLAYHSNATQGFCSDTRRPEGCWQYLLARNVTTLICE
ncbi:MAG: hypothetical protein Q7R76_03845 [Candidatus Woesearchaeota archaeon]|nr:hypothetical protein [Candidatus Woesearchaeota archaeon]